MKGRTKFIYLSGLMGSGKSTLAPLLASSLPNSALFCENVDENLYLKDFFGDMKKWGFHSRISFLGVKAKIYKEVSRETEFAIVDRGLFELLPYAKLHYDLGNMDERDFRTYLSLYDSFKFFIPKPDLIIYLTCSLDLIARRIKVRNRDFEQNVSTTYLEQGRNYYDNWYDSAEAIHKVSVDTSDFDLETYRYLAAKLVEEVILVDTK